MIKRGPKVTVCNIKAGIDDKFNYFQWISVGAHVTRVAYPIIHDGDGHTVRLLLLGAFLAYNWYEGYFLPNILGDVVVVDDVEGVGAIESFAFFVWSYSNASVQSVYLIVKRSVPGVG